MKHNKSLEKTYDVVELAISAYVVNAQDKAVTMKRRKKSLQMKLPHRKTEIRLQQAGDEPV